MFLEFPGASGNPVFINVGCIAQISIGSPQPTPSGVFFDPIHVTFKEGCEGLIDEFMIDDDYAAAGVNGARKVLCDDAFYLELRDQGAGE